MVQNPKRSKRPLSSDPSGVEASDHASWNQGDEVRKEKKTKVEDPWYLIGILIIVPSRKGSHIPPGEVRKIIFKMDFSGDMLVFRRVV